MEKKLLDFHHQISHKRGMSKQKRNKTFFAKLPHLQFIFFSPLCFLSIIHTCFIHTYVWRKRNEENDYHERENKNETFSNNIFHRQQ